jgi:hypothetical protein
MGSIIKRFDRPLSSRKNAPPQRVKSTPEQDAKSLHESVAATLRMFREDHREKAKFAPDKRDILAQAYLAKNDRESQKALAGILKRVKKFKWRAK